MSDRHLTLDGLVRFAAVDPSEQELGAAAAHLAVCKSCRDLLGHLPEEVASEVRQLLVMAPAAKRFSTFDYRRAVLRVVERARSQERREELEVIAAESLLEELERYPVAQRRMIAANLERFRSRSLVQLLLERARKTWTGDPDLAESRALLACDISERLQADGYEGLLLNDLKGEAWSYLANSHRIRGRLSEAEKLFEQARGYLAEGSGDRGEEVRFLDLYASLLRDQGRLEAAAEALEAVICVHRQAGDLHSVGRGLISKAFLLERTAQFEESVHLLRQAEPLLDHEREPLLELTRRVNLISCLLELGRALEAQAHLVVSRRLAKLHGNRLDRLRVRWVEGQVLCALGQAELGKEVLRSVHDGLVQLGALHEVAAVALDLAKVCLAEGRLVEVHVLVEGVRSWAASASEGEVRNAVEALFLSLDDRNAAVAGVLLNRLLRHFRYSPTQLQD